MYITYDDTQKGIQLNGWQDYVDNVFALSGDYGDGTVVEDDRTHFEVIPMMSLLVRGVNTNQNGAMTWTGYT